MPTDMRDARAGAVVGWPTGCTKEWFCGRRGLCMSDGTDTCPFRPGGNCITVSQHNKPLAIKDQLAAANAVIRERDQRITRLETALRKIILHFQEARTSADPRMHQLLNDAAITLAEMRTESGYE